MSNPSRFDVESLLRWGYNNIYTDEGRKKVPLTSITDLPSHVALPRAVLLSNPLRWNRRILSYADMELDHMVLIRFKVRFRALLERYIPRD